MGSDPVFKDAATALGTAVAEAGLTLVYGGGHVGLMGVVADSALAAGGRVTGVITRLLVDKELAHHGITELHTVSTMSERKALMADLAEGFISMPGGYGTLDEFCEMVTWTQLGLHQKPHGILNVDGFYDALLAFFETSVTNGFLKREMLEMVHVSSDPADLVAALKNDDSPLRDRWKNA
jgi:uncharacterized protein (TIGR00730 family)